MTTVILTGVWNTGKAYAANLIHNLGVKMDFSVGDEPIAFEDHELLYLFANHPQTIPVDLIRRRDAAAASWGTKMGVFWNSCAPATVHQLFRNPRVIIMQRDAAIVAEESGIEFDEIVDETKRSFYWSKRLECPVTHLSSEMLFREPVKTVLRIRDFLR